uniref:Major facilitator superfamily (MFS) profile domain-containing protein n=1 Tax=Globodera rostochiensis TaxID=31243 RepID=A0A914IAS4_GLORO
MYVFDAVTVAAWPTRKSQRRKMSMTNPIFRVALEPNCLLATNKKTSSSSTNSLAPKASSSGGSSKQVPLLPSVRLLFALCLCLVYITVSVSSSNIAVALICMIKCERRHGYHGTIEWETDKEGLLLAAQNIGSLLMLVTGFFADRINGKWMVAAGLALCLAGNLALPLLAAKSFWYAFGARIAIGSSDAFIAPAMSSLITRWFPHTERAVAIGCITGGRQLGTLFILPVAGALCGHWPLIFHLSTLVTAFAVFFWLPIGADKPSKQCCMPNKERLYIESRIACEHIGKRTQPRQVPWRKMAQSVPLWINVLSLICHEYPLVIMLQFLPNYMRDVLELAPTQNGLLSALPILFLLASKWMSSSLSSWISSRREATATASGDIWYERRRGTRICKAFNAVASFGLAVCIAAVPQFNKQLAHWAVVALCGAMAFAGFHTPGVQTALLQLAPPFSGIITGIAFFVVSIFSIGNKMLTKWIVQNGTKDEWAMVFYVSAVVAALPVLLFTVWGSDQPQAWARGMKRSQNSIASTTTTATTVSSSVKRKHPSADDKV